MDPGSAVRRFALRKGDFDVYVKEEGGNGAEQAVLSGPDDTDPIAWTRDGRLVFQGSEPDNTYPLKLLDPRGRSISRLTEQHVDNGGSLSPDDRWLAYQSAAGGRSIVYVRPLTGAAPAVALSRDSGEFPMFLRDGRTLALVRGRQLLVRPWRDDKGRFEVGPLTEEGNPISGNTFLNFSTELRVPIVGKLGAVLFFDGGNVWADPWDFNLDDMRYDVGPGLRYNTPVGPIRLDLGYQLKPIEGLLVNGEEQKRRFRVHFSIGQAF